MRHIAADGKVFVNSDSFLPATLVGHKVDCYAEDPQSAPKAVADGGLGSKLGQGLVQPPTTHTATPPHRHHHPSPPPPPPPPPPPLPRAAHARSDQPYQHKQRWLYSDTHSLFNHMPSCARTCAPRWPDRDWSLPSHAQPPRCCDAIGHIRQLLAQDDGGVGGGRTFRRIPGTVKCPPVTVS